jgi:hypothetical protein
MIRRLLVVSAVLVVAPSAALAHKLELRATPTADHRLRVEAAYEGGDSSDGTTVTLADATGTTVAEAATDADGICFLPQPPDGEYTLTADDGAGHRAQTPLSIPWNEIPCDTRWATIRYWSTTLLGLVIIAGLTLLARRLMRRPG